jgi:thioredoxin reductase (NADPH)
LSDFEGRGVSYWASALEAKMCENAEVILVGGGNSAGQAAVFLANQASLVHVLVRGSGLAASMSRYLIDRIAAAGNITLHPHTELTHLHADAAGHVESVTWRDSRDGAEETRSIRYVFLFVGADPETEWLADCGVALDAHGFVLTGQALGAAARARQPASLESSVRGVFAVGDVRSGSVKRVGGAIGEGAAVVALVHQYLASLGEAAPSR